MDSSKKQVSFLKKQFEKFTQIVVKVFDLPKSVFWGKKKKPDALDYAEMQKEYDKKLVYSLSKSRIPTFKQLKYIKRYLSPLEKKLIYLSSFLIIVSSTYLGINFYLSNLELIPVPGGEYVEGLIGSPQTINPLYTVSDVDNDLSFLIYSSLFRRGANGQLEKDLVEDFFVSGDNKTYEITLKEGVKWHNDEDLTINDVIFTYNAILDPSYKSPLRQSFAGVNIEAVDERTVRFLLPEPYAAFLELLTFGILPANLWSEIPADTANLATLNQKPIGSGPFKFKSLAKNEAGNIKEYKLEKNEDYYGKVPYIDISLKFYTSFDEAIEDLNNKAIDGMSYLPSEYVDFISTPKSLQFHKILYPQVTLIFLNEKLNEALASKELRQALAYAIDKRAIVNDVLKSQASVVDSPIPSNSFAYNNDIKKYYQDIPKAEELLNEAGWVETEITEEEYQNAQDDAESDDEEVKNQAFKIIDMGVGTWRKKDDKFLTINLRTVERSENAQVISEIQKYWEQVGIKVITEVIPLNRIQGDVIRTRNFEALFYAQVLGSDPDPYAFWHSSQIENGYNIANFSNKEADKLLEEARLEAEQTLRQDRYKQFQDIIAEEEPVIFMYSPLYTYLQNTTVKGFDVSYIITPTDRFSNIFDWYIKTGKKLIINK
ncbi:hypothetical protein C0583_06885 [Candidatus Parcubacteria bacterium]|nr:MAG: hypothetical protein C0583_06885 [Candidatus Parcubacteria bacterium]